MKQILSPANPLSKLRLPTCARAHRFRFIGAIFFLALQFFSLPTEAASTLYHGQVVDAETGKPIEGAVMLVEWHKKSRLALGGMSYFHNARETLTDAEGKFSMDSSPGIDWNPLTYILPPRIIVFYPGYLPFTPAQIGEIGIKGGLVEIAGVFEKGVVVKLRKITSEKELKYYTSQGSLGPIWAPYGVLPNLWRLFNIQRKMAKMDELTYP